MPEQQNRRLTNLFSNAVDRKSGENWEKIMFTKDAVIIMSNNKGPMHRVKNKKKIK